MIGNDVLKNIKIDDLELDEKNTELVELLGFDKYFEFLELYGGSRIYVNKFDEIIKKARDKKILSEYNGYNVKQLASKYRLTEKTIEIIVKVIKQEKKNDYK